MAEAAAPATSGGGVNQGWLPKTAATVALLAGVCTAAYGWAVLHVVFPNLFGDRAGFGWLGAATGVGGGVLALAGAVGLWRCAQGRSARGALQVGAAAAAVAALPSLGDLVQFTKLSWQTGDVWESGSIAGWWPALPAALPLVVSLALVCVWPFCRRPVAVEEKELPTSIGLGSRIWARGLLALLAVGWSWWALAPLGWYGRTDLPLLFRRAPDDALPPLDLAAAQWRIDYERSQPGLWYRDWFQQIAFWVMIAEELDAGATQAQRQGERPKYRLAYPGTLDAAAGLAAAGADPGNPALDAALLRLAADPHLMVHARDEIVWTLASRRDLAEGSVRLLLAIARGPALSDDALLDYGEPLEPMLPMTRREQTRRLRKTAFNALADLGAAAAPVLAQLEALRSDADFGADAEYAVDMIRADLDVPAPDPDDAGSDAGSDAGGDGR